MKKRRLVKSETNHQVDQFVNCTISGLSEREAIYFVLMICFDQSMIISHKVIDFSWILETDLMESSASEVNLWEINRRNKVITGQFEMATTVH